MTRTEKMFPIFIAVFCILGSVWGNGEFVVFHAPPSVKFLTGAKSLPADLIPDVVMANLGFTTSTESSWPGLVRLSPFQSARLAVIVSLDGPSARLPGEVLSRTTSVARYALSPMPGEGPSTWWATLRHAAAQRQMLNASASLVTLDTISTGSLSTKVDEDQAWLREMQSIRSIIQKAAAGELCAVVKGPAVLWLESTALHGLSDFHGAGSIQAIDASKMLGSLLAGLSEELQNDCDGKVLLAAVTSDSSHTRRTRSLLQATAKPEAETDHNISKQYDANYPVIFNIFLFFGIGFVVALIAISMALASMDPGRDSIIYRMTNPRMKKDN
ncbi:hypothetical protein B566_EDAN009488 [Ephemera danica]|nr:hypothetical protein B566_EDAN009488 [Ephemera danica]